MAKQKKGFHEVNNIPRNEIKEADYNPRIIDEDNLKKLTKDIREHGLVTPLVWNKRTGVLVSGHQRLAAMDKIHRDDGISFEDMGFNKADIDFMFDGEVDFDADAANELDGVTDGDSGADEQPAVSKRDTPFDEDVEDEKDKLADMGQFTGEEGLDKFNKKKAEFRHRDNDTTIINFYTKVVFPDNDTKKEFYRKANIPANEEYITFDQVKRYFEGTDK